ncbi:hypothetical protein ABT116_03830 [Streptomyces sp. NPDC002130]|uniref:hypothetical protein n=1 Tax=Streptomyces sp. NPDC002130 TaxID=3155568 RepID=UPI003326B258
MTTAESSHSSRRPWEYGLPAPWTATVGGIFTGGVLGTLLLVPLGTGRALLVIAAAVLLLAVAGMVAPPGETEQVEAG